MTIAARIVDYEMGIMAEDEIPKLFQELIDNGMAWTLQGHYGRLANALITAGICHAAGSSTTTEEEINV